MRHWTRRLLPAALLVAAVLLVSGCFAVSLDLTVRDDGSVSARSKVTVNDEVLGLALLAGEFETREEACADFLEQMAEENDSADGMLGGGLIGSSDQLDPAEASDDIFPATTVETVNADGECSFSESAEWTAEDGEQLLAALGDDFPIRATENGWRFELRADSQDDVAVSGDEMAALGALGLESLPTLRISVVLPGFPVEHNAVTADGNRFVWEYTLDELPPSLIYAETSISETLIDTPTTTVGADAAPVTGESTTEQPEATLPPTATGTTLPEEVAAKVAPDLSDSDDGSARRLWMIPVSFLAGAGLAAAVIAGRKRARRR